MIEMVVYGIFFLLMCTVGYLTLNALHKKHKEKHHPVPLKSVGPWIHYYVDPDLVKQIQGYVEHEEMESKDG